MLWHRNFVVPLRENSTPPLRHLCLNIHLLFPFANTQHHHCCENCPMTSFETRKREFVHSCFCSDEAMVKSGSPDCFITTRRIPPHTAVSIVTTRAASSKWIALSRAMRPCIVIGDFSRAAVALNFAHLLIEKKSMNTFLVNCEYRFSCDSVAAAWTLAKPKDSSLDKHFESDGNRRFDSLKWHFLFAEQWTTQWPLKLLNHPTEWRIKSQQTCLTTTKLSPCRANCLMQILSVLPRYAD